MEEISDIHFSLYLQAKHKAKTRKGFIKKKKSRSNRETIRQTGVICNKISCYMRDSACRWLIVENAKIFRSYVKIFLFFLRERNCRILIGLCKYVFMNHPVMFLDRDNKTKLVSASFFTFQNFYERKIKFNLKIAVLISLINIFFTIFCFK